MFLTLRDVMLSSPFILHDHSVHKKKWFAVCFVICRSALGYELQFASWQTLWCKYAIKPKSSPKGKRERGWIGKGYEKYYCSWADFPSLPVLVTGRQEVWKNAPPGMTQTSGGFCPSPMLFTIWPIKIQSRQHFWQCSPTLKYAFNFKRCEQLHIAKQGQVARHF